MIAATHSSRRVHRGGVGCAESRGDECVETTERVWLGLGNCSNNGETVSMQRFVQARRLCCLRMEV